MFLIESIQWNWNFSVLSELTHLNGIDPNADVMFEYRVGDDTEGLRSNSTSHTYCTTHYIPMIPSMKYYSTLRPLSLCTGPVLSNTTREREAKNTT
jgi:hypothetical protein